MEVGFAAQLDVGKVVFKGDAGPYVRSPAHSLTAQ
jgi:hypothetical protein